MSGNMNLKKMKIVACPKCNAVGNVTKNIQMVTSFPLFCKSCEIGFIPDSMLEELGIEENKTRGRFGRSRPYGVGHIVPDNYYD